MRKWSVDEFEGLIRHQLTDCDGLSELIAGRIVPLPTDDVLKGWIQLLHQQLQRHLTAHPIDDYLVDGCAASSVTENWVVRSHPLIRLNDHSVLRPSLVLCSLPISPGELDTATALRPEQVCWALDIRPTDAEDALRVQLYAEGSIAHYWHYLSDQVALRLHSQPTDVGYQHRRLLQVGEQAALAGFPFLRFCLQEPLPLHFLTCTSQGQRTCLYKKPPLLLCV
ncbi:MAG: hypothetical protein AAFY72_08045 [Cyanobacteria bacterium J06649_4]